MGRLDFAATIRNMVNLGSDRQLLRAVVAALPATYTNRGLNLPGFALAPHARAAASVSIPICTDTCSAKRPACSVGRMEALRTDLPRLLDFVGEPVSDDLRRHIACGARSNVSPHWRYEDYYEPGAAQIWLPNATPR